MAFRMLMRTLSPQALAGLSRQACLPALAAVRAPACAAHRLQPSLFLQPAQHGAQVRALIASATAEASGLREVLDEEIKYEADSYISPPEVGSPPEPWKIIDEPGSSKVILQRDYDKENIKVTAIVDEQEDGYEDEGEEGEEGKVEIPNGVVFSVHIDKGDKGLILECRCDPDGVQIMHVGIPTGEREDAYSGPEFDELDERVQAGFSDMLAARGVDRALADFIVVLVDDKEQREYVNWLKKTASFLTS